MAFYCIRPLGYIVCEVENVKGMFQPFGSNLSCALTKPN